MSSYSYRTAKEASKEKGAGASRKVARDPVEHSSTPKEEKGAGASRKVARSPVEPPSTPKEEKEKLQFSSRIYHTLNQREPLYGDALEETMDELRESSPQLKILWKRDITVGDEEGHRVRMPASLLVRARLMHEIDFKAFLVSVDPFITNRVWKTRKPEGGATRRPSKEEESTECDVDLDSEKEETDAKPAPARSAPGKPAPSKYKDADADEEEEEEDEEDDERVEEEVEYDVDLDSEEEEEETEEKPASARSAPSKAAPAKAAPVKEATEKKTYKEASRRSESDTARRPKTEEPEEETEEEKPKHRKARVLTEEEHVRINSDAMNLIKKFRKSQIPEDESVEKCSEILSSRVRAVKAFPQLKDVPDRIILKFVQPSTDNNWMGKFVRSVGKFVPSNLRKE